MKTPLFSVLALSASLITFTSSAWAKEDIQTLREREAKVIALAAKANTTTVAILSKSMMGAGSGVVVDKSGLVLTASHVVQAAGDDLEVVFPDGRRFSGISLGQNRGLDAAMVQIQSDEEFAYVEVGDSSKLELGQWCVAMGHPGGYDRLRTPPVRLGRVWSMQTPGMVDMLVSDCTLIGGDSGGPLFDLDGKVIGIHSSIGGGLEQNRHVPVSVFTKYWDRLKNNERWGSIGMMSANIEDPDRPMLGIQMLPTEKGVVVGDVFPNSPADKAGVKTTDQLISIDDKKFADSREIAEFISSKKIGDQITIIVKRDAEELTLTATLTAAQNIEFRDPFGLGQHPEIPEKKPARFGAMMEKNGEQAEVVSLIPGSAAEKAGILSGDTIIEINGKAITDTQSFVEEISAFSANDTVKIKLQREDASMEIEITLGAAE
jgi:serine protease Do